MSAAQLCSMKRSRSHSFTSSGSWLCSAASGPARAQDDATERDEPGFCSRPLSRDDLLKSPAAEDLYNGLLFMGGVGAAHFGGWQSARWTRRNGFDDGIRSGLRISSASGRKDADTASDVFLGFSVGLLPVAAIGRPCPATLARPTCHAE